MSLACLAERFRSRSCFIKSFSFTGSREEFHEFGLNFLKPWFCPREISHYWKIVQIGLDRGTVAQKGKNVLSMPDWIGKRYSQKHSQTLAWLRGIGTRYKMHNRLQLSSYHPFARKQEERTNRGSPRDRTTHTGNNMLSNHASCIGKMQSNTFRADPSFVLRSRLWSKVLHTVTIGAVVLSYRYECKKAE